MPTLDVQVPLTPAYNAAYQQLVAIYPTAADLSIDIQEGTHTYTSPFYVVGALKYSADPRLEAAIRITYSYDAAEGVLELFGNDFVSAGQSTCLLIRPYGANQLRQLHTYLDSTSPWGIDLTGTYPTQYTPGLAKSLTDSIRNANQKIIDAAEAMVDADGAVVRIVRVNTPPPVPASVEETNKWMTMYAKDGTNLGAFDPTREYPEGTTMKNHLTSTWGGTVRFRHGENIANVIGSSPDPKLLPGGKPWIEVWETQFGLEDSCTSHDWASGGPFSCNDSSRANIIGGHVIAGTVAQRVPPGSNYVYIVPICKRHNNDNNVYMGAFIYTQGIWLNNYLQ
jgi:hypothetical protein